MPGMSLGPASAAMAAPAGVSAMTHSQPFGLGQMDAAFRGQGQRQHSLGFGTPGMLGFPTPFSPFHTPAAPPQQASPATTDTDDLMLSEGGSLDDDERDLRKLKKRMRQIEDLQRKVEEGDRLDEKQRSKLRSREEVLRHIADLEDRLQLRLLSGIDAFTG